jgi:serine O-acetyltransferase
VEVALASDEAYEEIMVKYAATDGFTRYSLYEDRFFTILRENWEQRRADLNPGGDPVAYADLLRQYVEAPYRTGLNVARVYDLLCEQIHAGLCFANVEGKKERRKMAKAMAVEFVESLPELRRSLLMDVVAMYDGDPAAKSYGEIISCYPAIKAIGNYRMAHKLIEIGVPLIPRIISELAHSETGIDIHPGATIGNYFAIDHGTGVVIGETCIIGNHVKLYQGVTLGAKSFPVDENGNPIKGIPRHPILEDNVIVYGNSTILGRVTIGKDAVIGANIWLMENVAPGTKVVQKKNI